MSDDDLYRLRLRVLEDVEARVASAEARQDRRAYAAELCERAWAAMGLRDLFEIGSEPRARWDHIMRRDLRRAQQMADALESAA